MADRSRHRGFTLVEMLVALAASAVVLTVVIGAALAQQRAFFGSEKIRAAQSSARAAQLFLEEKLRLAGFGVEPALAFDFQFYTPDHYPSFPCPAEAGGCPRDATDNNDELVFYERNPNYWVPNNLTDRPAGKAWRVQGLGDAKITVDVNQGDVFPAGQILAVVCPGGRYYTYVTVSQTTPAAAAAGFGGPGAQEVPLLPSDPLNPFRRQDILGGATASDPPSYFDQAGNLLAAPTPSACVSTGQARLFQIDRYRFHVRPVVVGSFADGKTKYDPYLVLDMGVDTNGDGDVDGADEMVIAEGVELFQVAYVLANPALPTPAAGASPGVAITFTPGMPGSTDVADEITTVELPPPVPFGFAFAPRLNQADNPYAATSWYSYSQTPPLPSNHPRMTNAQGNIRAVQVAMVVRSPEPTIPPSQDSLLGAGFRLLNLDTVPAWIRDNASPGVEWDGYQRVQVQSGVLVPNMASRGLMFF